MYDDKERLDQSKTSYSTWGLGYVLQRIPTVRPGFCDKMKGSISYDYIVIPWNLERNMLQFTKVQVNVHRSAIIMPSNGAGCNWIAVSYISQILKRLYFCRFSKISFTSEISMISPFTKS